MDMRWLQKQVKDRNTDWEQFGDVRAKYDGDLVIFNYTLGAEKENRWNWFERASRGLILNWKTGEVVARPFDKFFNHGQRGRYPDPNAHMKTITEKMDGSLGILYRNNGYKIATRGSMPIDEDEYITNFLAWAIDAGFEYPSVDLLKFIIGNERRATDAGWQAPCSAQSVWATKMLNGRCDLNDVPDEYTLLFEIIYPDNRIVVDYHGREALVLIAIRNRFTGEYLPFYGDENSVYRRGYMLGFSIPETSNFNRVYDILETLHTLTGNEEGYVVEYSDGTRWKFKGDRYIELHRLVTNSTFKRVLAAVRWGTYDDMVANVPDEFLHDIKTWKAQIDGTVAALIEQVENVFCNAPDGDRKTFALWANQEHKAIAPYLFCKLDGRDYIGLIYKCAFRKKGQNLNAEQEEMRSY